MVHVSAYGSTDGFLPKWTGGPSNEVSNELQCVVTQMPRRKADP